MIVWVSSYPRSGNTFMRILLNKHYALTSSTVYDVDEVAARLGADLVGYRDDVDSLTEMRASDAVFFVKTHRPFDVGVDESDGAICLVRDGRDAVVSWARQRAEQPDRSFQVELHDLILHPNRLGAGCWGSNVLSWLESGLSVLHLTHYHELVSQPLDTIIGAMDALGLSYARMTDAVSPSFQELHAIDPAFFRTGMVGTHKKEMPDGMQDAFLAIPDNRLAMERLGYLD